MDYCDEIASSHLDASLLEVLYRKDNKNESFDDILYSNPALLAIEYSLCRILMEMKLKPDYLLGYSLGEITASIVSGAVSFEDGIRLVVEHAKILKSQAPTAGMLAVIESPDIVEKYPDIFEGCWITGNNFSNNFVVSGLEEHINRSFKALGEREIICQKLPVAYGFHTPLMDNVKKPFTDSIRTVNFSKPYIPTVSCLTGQEVKELDDEYFWNVIREPVAFEKAVAYLLDKNDYIFIDVGPSGVLATCIKYILPSNSSSVHLEVINQFGKDLQSLEKFIHNTAIQTHLS